MDKVSILTNPTLIFVLQFITQWSGRVGLKQLCSHMFLCFCVGCDCVFLIFLRALSSLNQDLPDIVFIGKNYDDPRIWVFSESSDDLVKLSLLGLSRNLDGLGDAHTP